MVYRVLMFSCGGYVSAVVQVGEQKLAKTYQCKKEVKRLFPTKS